MKAQFPRKRRRRRKCQCCGELYMPDVRHFRDQKYCSKPECKRASKLASHRRWLRSRKGAEYRDPEEGKRRVREWREKHPGYSRLTAGRRSRALRDTCSSQMVDREQVNRGLSGMALRDTSLSEPALAVGLIAILTGSASQETIVPMVQRSLLLGRDILGIEPGVQTKGEARNETCKATPVCGTIAARAGEFQLGGSSPGA